MNEKEQEILKIRDEMREDLKNGNVLETMEFMVSHFIEHVLTPVLGVSVLFISDESSIFDLCFDDARRSAILSRIDKVYGVDVSHIESGNLVEVVRFIVHKIHLC